MIAHNAMGLRNSSCVGKAPRAGCYSCTFLPGKPLILWGSLAIKYRKRGPETLKQLTIITLSALRPVRLTRAPNPQDTPADHLQKPLWSRLDESEGQ